MATEIRKVYRKDSSASGGKVQVLFPADSIAYNNSSHGSSTNVQDMLEEVYQMASTGGVTGVKGNNETSYRTGNVNLTPANIGAPTIAQLNSVSSTANESYLVATQAKDIALGKDSSVSYNNIQSFVADFNVLPKTNFKVGDNVYIRTHDVPDLWISTVAASSVQYTYTSDDAFVNALSSSEVQVGYYKVSALETAKIDLSDYQTKTDNTLVTTNKTVVGAINELDGSIDSTYTLASNANSTASSANTKVDNILNGTSKVPKATDADKWATGISLGVSVKSGKKSDGSTDISGSGSQTVDGSSGKTISVTLGDSGVSAGTYSAVTVNAKGVVVNGGLVIDWGTASDNTPASNLVEDGLFFELV